MEVGAELFVGNLDSMVDEKTLYDTFSAFGSLVSAPKVLYPPLSDTGVYGADLVDCPRRLWYFKGIRFHLVRLVRSFRQGDRKHGQAVPDEQGD